MVEVEDVLFLFLPEDRGVQGVGTGQCEGLDVFWFLTS